MLMLLIDFIISYLQLLEWPKSHGHGHKSLLD